MTLSRRDCSATVAPMVGRKAGWSRNRGKATDAEASVHLRILAAPGRSADGVRRREGPVLRGLVEGAVPVLQLLARPYEPVERDLEVQAAARVDLLDVLQQLGRDG